MMKYKKLCLFSLLLLLILITISFSASSVDARKNNEKHQKQKKRSGNDQTANGPVHSPVPSPISSPNGPYLTPNSIFDIFSFGAKGDGVSDDSKAFEAAWKAACRVPEATVEIPSEFRFLIKPVTLQGPCMTHLVLQIDGTLLAPPKVRAWPKSSLFQWINFKWVQNFTIQGTGTVDGQGSAWWNPSGINYIQKKKKKSKYIPNMKPTALRFYGSNNVKVRDISIINSPGCHLKFDSTSGVMVDNITISSPGDSPNTDGIHLQNAHDVEIQLSNIGCGDDCVSIQTGCTNVHVHDVNCGPGHGISLGGLGKDKSVACVSGIVVENINVRNALSGVRIKTWQGGMGSVNNISFSNIQVADVGIPIIIDQYYCDKRICKNQTGAVAITGVNYNQIIGTFSVQPIHLACSNNVPCLNIDLIDIQLEPSPSSKTGFQKALCWNSYGKSQAPLVPSTMDYCLRSRGSSSWTKQPEKSHDHSC